MAEWNKQGKKGQDQSSDYFALEYKLDHVIATYNKPYVAFMDGITMGGGVGLSVHAPFRIATEKTVFAMPETTIGFFPDVGASFFLPRMDGQLGTYLALTSEQLKGVNVFYAGIATHYIDSSSLPDLEARLAELVFKDYTSANDRYEIIDKTIEEFATGIPHDVTMQVSGPIRSAIDYCFQSQFSIEDTLKALEQAVDAPGASEDAKKWATKTRETILARSPTSVKVTLEQLRRGRKWNIAETFRKEHSIASQFMAHHDFVEGVMSRLVQKRKPEWQPKDLEGVSRQDVETFFSNDQQQPLQLLNTGDGTAYDEYPHAWIGLPKEKEVEQAVKDGPSTSREDIVRHFLSVKNGKMGVREKVEEILARKTQEQDGRLEWLA